MNEVHEELVVDFIKNRAMKGPEGHEPKEGRYDMGLIRKAEIPAGSDFHDSELCPGY